MTHIYKEQDHAEFDLKIFSSMNCNEDKVLYLVNVSGGLEITQERPVDVGRVEAIGINGLLFIPK